MLDFVYFVFYLNILFVHLLPVKPIAPHLSLAKMPLLRDCLTEKLKTCIVGISFGTCALVLDAFVYIYV